MDPNKRNYNPNTLDSRLDYAWQGRIFDSYRKAIAECDYWIYEKNFQIICETLKSKNNARIREEFFSDDFEELKERSWFWYGIKLD